jgi:hypothetical protein
MFSGFGKIQKFMLSNGFPNATVCEQSGSTPFSIGRGVESRGVAWF